MMYWLTEKERAVILEALEHYKLYIEEYRFEDETEWEDKKKLIQRLIKNKINS